MNETALPVDTPAGGIGLLSRRTGGTVIHTLFFKPQNTGLTSKATEFSMSKVADRGLRFRFRYVQFRSGSLFRAPGYLARF
jgi:hypothetical protein